LAKRVIENTTRSREFVESININGIKWRVARIDRYYRKVEQFQE
jgi:hypothetical protein